MVTFLKIIIKPKFVLTCIALTTIATILGALIPQLSDKSPFYFAQWKLNSPITFYIVDTLQLNKVFTSVWFLSLVFIIMLSQIYSLYLMYKRNIRLHNVALQLAIPRESFQISFVFNGNDVQILKFMREKRYRLVFSTYNQLTQTQTWAFAKNSINKWAGMIFHTGLLLIMIAAFIGFAWQKRGFVQIIQGEVFSGVHEDFTVTELGVFQKRFDSGFKILLNKFNHEYWDTDQIKDISSEVTIINNDDQRVKDDIINVNNPLRYRGVNIYQSLNYGYVLTFVLKRQDNSETVSHFFLDHPDRRTKPFVGKFDFPESQYFFKMKFYPDMFMNSFHLKRPILYLQVSRDTNTLIFDGLVIPANIINLEGNLVRFHSISQWSGLIYVKGVDMTIAYIGFFVCIIGASIMFLLPYKEIVISRKGNELSLQGYTNRYQPIFEEEILEIKGKLNEY